MAEYVTTTDALVALNGTIPFNSVSPSGYYLFMNMFWRPWPSPDDTSNKRNFYYNML